MPIITSYWAKPIPTPNLDWEAWIDGTEGHGMTIGYGPTKADAVADLQNQLEAN